MTNTKFAALARAGAIAAALGAAASVAGLTGTASALSALSADQVAGVDGDMSANVPSWALRRHHFGTPPPAPDASAPGANPGAPALGANPGVGMYGNPTAAAPYWRPQRSNDCVEMSVADVVGQITGDEPTEQQIDSVAEHSRSRYGPGPIYQPTGTDFRNVPVLLAHYGINSQLTNTRIRGLEEDLAQGHKVIASVNGETIWKGGIGPANHAVAVTGIDTTAGVVHLNDSGIRSGRDEQVPIATFERAWASGLNEVAVTN